MKKNVGYRDSTLRVTIAIIISVSYALGIIYGMMGIAALFIGLVLLITGISGYCPLYKIFGVDTYRK